MHPKEECTSKENGIYFVCVYAHVWESAFTITLLGIRNDMVSIHESFNITEI